MNELFTQLFLPSGLLFFPLIVGCMGSLTFGVVGSYVTARRVTYIGTGISHAVVGGVGAAFFFQSVTGWGWLSPTVGAFAAAVVSGVIIGRVILTSGHKADSVITAVMVIGMSSGVLFLNKTPGYHDPMSMLFGDILLVSRQDLPVIALVNAGVILIGLLFYNRLLMVCFDEEFARLRGINADAYFMLLILLTALTTVVMMKIVGVIMVIALLSLPAMTGALIGRKLWHCMLAATVICAFCVILGLVVSYILDLSSGPLIVVFSGAVHLVALTVRRFWPVSRLAHGS
ncbi:MAG: metal ABC transporter permease [Lentisphaeria bacterium]|nr:metal ABC transporter permease [Lentisphaeria bacterium]